MKRHGRVLSDMAVCAKTWQYVLRHPCNTRPWTKTWQYVLRHPCNTRPCRKMTAIKRGAQISQKASVDGCIVDFSDAVLPLYYYEQCTTIVKSDPICHEMIDPGDKGCMVSVSVSVVIHLTVMHLTVMICLDTHSCHAVSYMYY